ncbi:hypothetical protein L596_018336 [Steinernema carpocapsae]|uniref:Uncharacterized protein n=1 Tax=Steinernema carpocapsae TaxID=34508 RepID=A0A4U5N5C8_STECR|nr:hypothetical protein L596_018336 [Steinernema carpocapsae]
MIPRFKSLILSFLGGTKFSIPTRRPKLRSFAFPPIIQTIESEPNEPKTFRIFSILLAPVSRLIFVRPRVASGNQRRAEKFSF